MGKLPLDVNQNLKPHVGMYVQCTSAVFMYQYHGGQDDGVMGGFALDAIKK